MKKIYHNLDVMTIKKWSAKETHCPSHSSLILTECSPSRGTLFLLCLVLVGGDHFVTEH